MSQNNLQLDCSKCGERMQVQENMTGEIVRCPHCQSKIQIPSDLSNRNQNDSRKTLEESTEPESDPHSSNTDQGFEDRELEHLPDHQRFTPETASARKAISRGFSICNDNFGTMFLIGFLYFAMSMGINFLLGIIPLGNLLSLVTPFVITAPLLVGLSYVGIRAEEQLPVKPKHLFEGFEVLGTAAISHLLIALFTLGSLLPGIFIITAGIGTGYLQGFEEMKIPIIVVVVLGILVAAVGAGILMGLYYWTPFAIATGYDEFWDAMEISRKIGFKTFWSTMGFLSFSFAVNAVGTLFCFIGLCYTLPLTYCVGACFFRSSFGRFKNVSALFE